MHITPKRTQTIQTIFYPKEKLVFPRRGIEEPETLDTNQPLELVQTYPDGMVKVRVGTRAYGIPLSMLTKQGPLT